MNLLILGLLAGTFIACLSALNWRLAVKTTLVVVVIEGALRKWAFPQASQLLYFLKDFILFGAYISYFSLPNTKLKLAGKHHTITALTCIVALWCLFQSFNPSLGSFVIGIFGIKNYLFYLPLMWLLPHLFRSEEELYKFLRSYLLLLIPVGILAIAQFLSPPSSPLNVYVNDDTAFALSGNNTVRVTGTFSYIAGYSIYLGFCLCLLLPLLTRQQSRLWRSLTIVEVLLVVITSFMTGARGLMIIAILLIVGYFSLQGLTQLGNILRSIPKFILPGILAFIATTVWFRPAVEAFWIRASTSNDLPARIVGSFTDPFRFFAYKGIDGYGTGATFQANGIIRALLNLPSGEYIPVFYESEMGRIALELGPIGFLLWYGFKLVLLLALWNVYRQLKRPFLRQLALSAFLLQAIMFNSQLIFNPTANLYYWFLNGFIFLLPQLEQKVNWQHYQQTWQLYVQSSDFPDSPHK
ncbi:hypothetical protein [Coleofasciculus sp. E1-EBD-02]|uniref:hypothetical protein n=1 Tax=Coleofasciculus sp. E1-EBD-02 TaxID=3068481 RepID=UPI0032FD042E